ncbi:Protein RTA1 [Fusarium oxysporum f. sp. albedinis]|nr:Protein RTA1 [Fusarium oxysporum f. sp. albedinis]
MGLKNGQEARILAPDPNLSIDQCSVKQSNSLSKHFVQFGDEVLVPVFDNKTSKRVPTSPTIITFSHFFGTALYFPSFGSHSFVAS